MTAVAKGKRRTRPVYLTVRQMIDQETGEVMGALVPSTSWDRKAMRDRKYATGTELRAELKKPRNPKFNRLVHALGAMLVEHLDAFSGMDAHDAIKRCQRESGLFCEKVATEVPGLGTLTLNMAQSLAFDSMDEGAFQELFRGLCRHVSSTYWLSMTEDQIAEQAELMESTGP